MKKCHICKNEPVAENQTRCKKCNAEYSLKRYHAKKDEINKNRRKTRNYEKESQAKKRYRRDNPNYLRSQRKWYLEKKYKITIEEYESLLNTQNGKCAICKTSTATHVDHDHRTGKVRELLCNTCNAGLGMAKDNPSILRIMADYIERHLKESK